MNMAQPEMARITCSQCNAWYDSERELHEHMKTAHRGGGSEQSSSQGDGREHDSAKIQPREDQTTSNHEGGSGHGDSGRGGSPGQRSAVAAETKLPMETPLKSGESVRMNLAGMQVEGTLFHAAVTDAVGMIVKQTSENPPKYLVRLLFSFRGINELEVPAERIRRG
jgi:hypothetical protein